MSDPAKNPKLIQCGDHKWAPWCIVCCHVMDGTANGFVRVPGTDGSQDDWLCPECFAKGPNDIPVDDLRAVCIHCARELVKKL